MRSPELRFLPRLRIAPLALATLSLLGACGGRPEQAADTTAPAVSPMDLSDVSDSGISCVISADPDFPPWEPANGPPTPDIAASMGTDPNGNYVVGYVDCGETLTKTDIQHGALATVSYLGRCLVIDFAEVKPSSRYLVACADPEDN